MSFTVTVVHCSLSDNPVVGLLALATHQPR